MSGEQRVTDEAVQHIVVHGRVPTGGLATQYEIRLANALAEERLCTANLDTMGRATEAKLVERENQLADAIAKAGRFEGQLATLRTAYETSVRGQAEAEAKLTAALAEVERLKAIVDAADKGSPIYAAVERILDEKSAWIARPSAEVTRSIAMATGIAWGAASKDVAGEMFDRATAAESALSATKAKLEAVEEAIAETLKAYGALLNDYSGMSPHWNELEIATDKLAALTTQEKTDGR